MGRGQLFGSSATRVCCQIKKPPLFQGVKKKLEMATSKTKSWKDKVAQHEGLIRLIEPGNGPVCVRFISLFRCGHQNRVEKLLQPKCKKPRC